MINFNKIKNLDSTKRLELAKETGFFVGNPDLSDDEFKSLDDYYDYCFDKKIPYITVGDNMNGRGWVLITCPNKIDRGFLDDCNLILKQSNGEVVNEGSGGISSLIDLKKLPHAINSILVFWNGRSNSKRFDLKRNSLVN